jgi:hypothetical protein
LKLQKVRIFKNLEIMNYCTSCGNKFNDLDKFCSSCGTKKFEGDEENISPELNSKENLNNDSSTASMKLFSASIKSNNLSIKEGFVDEKGNWIIQPIYDYVYIFDESGYCKVIINDKYGFVDISGNWVIQPIFDNCGSFDKEGYSSAKLNGKSGFIDRLGNWIIKPIYDVVFPFNESGYTSACINQKYGIIDRLGNWIIQPIYDVVSSFNESGYASACTNQKYGIIDKLGNWIIQPIYDKNIYFDNEGFLSVKINGESGFVDISGNWVIQPIFDDCGGFDKEGYSYAILNDKYGFIDRLGNWIIQPIYDVVSSFNESGYASACINQKYGIIDRLGNWIIQPIFDNCGSFDKEGYSYAKLNDKCGIIDISGNWVIHPIFDHIDSIVEKIFRVESKSLFGLIDINSNWILEPNFLRIITIENDIYKVVLSNSKYGYYSTTKREWIIQPIFDSEFELDIDELIEDIKSEFVEIDGKIYIEEDIPIRKLNAFISSSFNDNELIDDVIENSIVYFDDTLWGKGDNGFLIFHLSQEIYVLINQFNQEPSIYNISKDIKFVNFSKDGVEITSLNNDENNLETKNHFRNQEVFESLFNSINIVLESRGSNKYEEWNDEDDFREEDIVDPLGLRENKRSGKDDDPLGLRN